MSNHFISIDVETDGITPYSNLLSIGAVVIQLDGARTNPAKMVNTFYEQLLPREDGIPNDKTVEWWTEDSERALEWKRLNTNSIDPKTALARFDDWIQRIGYPAIPIAWKPEFDMAFINYYSDRYLGKPQLFHRKRNGLDIKLLTALALNLRYEDVSLETHAFPEFGVDGKLDHNALNDAIMQGQVFIGAVERLDKTLGYRVINDTPCWKAWEYV